VSACIMKVCVGAVVGEATQLRTVPNRKALTAH
jgi:hypothetical protein